jgi:hypothetical protein
MGYSGDKSELKVLQQPKLVHMRDELAVGAFTDDSSSTAAELKPIFETSLSDEDFIILDYKLLLPPSLLVVAIVNKASDPKTNVQVIKRM